MFKTIPLLNEYKKLVKSMEDSGSVYLKSQSISLDRYVTQLESGEIERSEFKIMTQGIIEIKKIDSRQDYHSKDKIRRCIEDAKKLFSDVR